MRPQGGVPSSSASQTSQSCHRTSHIGGQRISLGFKPLEAHSQSLEQTPFTVEWTTLACRMPSGLTANILSCYCLQQQAHENMCTRIDVLVCTVTLGDVCTPITAPHNRELEMCGSSRKASGLTPTAVFALATPKAPLIGVGDGNYNFIYTAIRGGPAAIFFLLFRFNL
jgi:hypothetical protein